MPSMRSLWLLLMLGIGASAVWSQPRGRIPPYLQNPDRLDPAEGQRVIEQFRRIGLAGDFAFAVELIHEPRRAATETYTGTVVGTWGQAPQTRLDLAPLEVGAPPRRYLQWNGVQPVLWTVDWEASPPAVVQITGESLYRPLVPGITFTPYDLQMPFIYWRDFAYEGSNRLKGRPVHYFLLYPPAEDARYDEIGAVRVAIDADFNVAVRAETLDLEGNPSKRLDVQSVKKVQGQWIVRRLDLIDLVSEDRTRLEVVAAAVGIVVDDALLDPTHLADPDAPDLALEPL